MLIILPSIPPQRTADPDRPRRPGCRDPGFKMQDTPPPSAASPDQRRLLQSAALLQTAGRVARLGGWMIDVASERVFWSDEVCDIHEVSHGTVLTLEEAIRYYPAGWHAK